MNVLTGGGDRVSTENGTVTVNIEQIVDNVKQKLDARGITVFDDVQVPADKQQLVILQSDDLAQVQGLVDLLQTLAWVLPFVALACFAAAIGLSGNRRRTLQRGALGRRVRGRRAARAPQGRPEPLPRRRHHQEVHARCRRRDLGPAHDLPAHIGDHGRWCSRC